MTAKLFNGPFLAQLFKGAFSEWSKDNALRLSAALSYYSVFSIAPLLMIVIGLAGWFLGADAAQGNVEAQLTGIVGQQAAQALQTIIQSASKSSGGATIVGFVTLLIGASTVFGQLKDSLDTIWEVRPKAGLGIGAFIKDRLLTFGMVLVIGFLLLISLVLTTAIAVLNGWLDHQLGLPKFITGVIGFVIPLLVEAVLFALIFKMLPDADIEWRSVWVGATFTAVLFEIGKLGLSWYLARGSTTSSFGAAGSVVIILLWVYYASCILFFGAEITEVYARISGHSIQPAANAESTELKCAEGAAPGSGPVAAEPHPANPAVKPPSAPAYESLAPLIARTVLPDPEAVRRAALAAERPETLREYLSKWTRQADEHPVAELAAAVGVGVIVGLISRAFETKTLTPAEHFRLGAKDVAERGGAWASRLRGDLAEALDKVRG